MASAYQSVISNREYVDVGVDSGHGPQLFGAHAGAPFRLLGRHGPSYFACSHKKKLKKTRFIINAPSEIERRTSETAKKARDSPKLAYSVADELLRLSKSDGDAF